MRKTKTSKFFWNNNLWWLDHWYGISAKDKMYCGHDFVETNGRVFFKSRLSSLIGCNKEGLNDLENAYIDDRLRSADANDWAIGFVKPMSSKATIIEVLSADMHDEGHPTISVYSGGISWIDSVENNEDYNIIRVACASSKYLEDYNVKYTELRIEKTPISELRPIMILVEDDAKDDYREWYIFFTNTDNENHYVYSLNKDGSLTFISKEDTLYGYNEDTVYLGSDGQLIFVNRKSGEINNISSIYKEHLYTMVYENGVSLNNNTDLLAYVDAGRDEVFFYERQGVNCPGKCALIGISMGQGDSGYTVSKERIECPEVTANKYNPVVFDGSRYVWRITNLWSGFKIFRKDGTLEEKFLVNENDESAKSTVVFTTSSCVFVEWSQTSDPQDIRLSYTTNKGLCRMFSVGNNKRCLEVIQPEDEDRF